jgi:signal transduction histidine kinase
MPVRSQGLTAGRAVLIVGISPRRALDASYRRFFDLVAGQFAAALTDAQAYTAERSRAEALAALDHAKTLFFSNVSHEFRTPLTLLLGPLEEALTDPSLRDDARERLTLAHRNALRLLKLVNALLDFSRIEAGRVQASYELTDLAALTRDLSSMFRSAIERVGLTFAVECAALAEPVCVDREMWEKIVLNLLSNAFKFTLRGSITVRLRANPTHAVLEVADTGVGVSAQEIPRLFERFHRVEDTQGRTHEGSGIGLALVQELVKLHGGSIEVESVLGFGTTFRVYVPRGTAHLPADRLKTPAVRKLRSAGAQAFVLEALRSIPDATENPPSLPEVTASTTRPANERFASTFGARVVLADDNADMRAYVNDLLASHYRVETVADGEQAFAAALRERPDLILSDVMMPQLDGFGLLKRLRASEGLRDVPVILLSARAGEESRIEGLDAGADDYLVKPFSARELLARVGAMLERDRLHRQSLLQLETENRQKNEFLAMLAHELRNPLAPIRNASELLSRTVPAAEPHAHAAIDIVKRQVAHLTRLVDDLLDVSRITQGRIELRRQPLALADVISQALETVEPLFREKRHRVSTTLSFEPLPVYGDPARLVQCIANILTNAAKYTDPSGEIHVESHADGTYAVLTVRDDGAGIPQDLLPRVFDLFVQSQRTLDRAQGGLGIGLSVVRRLIEMHGGTVSASSAGLGRGSTFEIRLPLIERTTDNIDAGSMQPPAPRRILVVDDNQDVAESLAMLLTLDNHDVQSVYTPEHALQTVVSFKPEVVLLDIGLPGIDGYEVARRIRALPGSGNLRLVALTGYGQAEDRLRAQAAGFDDHLVKPVELATLQQSLARLS